eukprot:2214491-Rhodomonas_salina.2
MADGNCDEVRTSPLGCLSDVPWAELSAGPNAFRWEHTSAGLPRRRVWKRARGGRALDIMSSSHALWTPCGTDTPPMGTKRTRRRRLCGPLWNGASAGTVTTL